MTFKDFLTQKEQIINESELLLMGGNTRAINRQTGDVIAFADKVDLTKVQRQEFKKEMLKAFEILNDKFKKKFSYPLWLDFKVVLSGFAFNGSSDAFFDEKIPDNEFVKYKSTIGDVDITIPHEYLEPLFELLTTLEDKPITNRVSYIGQNKKTHYGHQINALFKYDNGNYSVGAQVDFEGSQYTEGRPTEWAKFSHNSSWDDVKQGFKGVLHKYWIQNLFRGISTKKDMAILTPASPVDDPKKIKLTKSIKGYPRMLAFNVATGLRTKYVRVKNSKGEYVQVDGKFAYKELKTKDSKYVTNIRDIFTMLFDREPNGRDLNDFDSFVGVTKLAKKNTSKDKIMLSFEQLMMNNLWGKEAQKLSRISKDEDLAVKQAMVNYLMKELPYLKKYQNEIEPMRTKYYEEYEKKKIAV